MKAKATGSGKNGTGLGGFLVMFSMKNFGRRGQGQGVGVRERRRGQGTNSVLPFLTNTDGHRCASLSQMATEE